MRRTLIILLVLLNAVAPTFAGTCASQCAGAEMSSFSEDQPAPDCHDPVAVDDGDSGGDGLMQSACAVAGAAALTPAISVISHDGPTDVAPATRVAFASRVTTPPDHPPRASSI